MGNLASAFPSELPKCLIGANSISFEGYGHQPVCTNQGTAVCPLGDRGYPVTNFCIRIAIYLLTTDDGTISFFSKWSPVLPPCFFVISNPQHPRNNPRCFCHYFLGRAIIHHANQICVVCFSWSLTIFYRETWLVNFPKPDTHKSQWSLLVQWVIPDDKQPFLA